MQRIMLACAALALGMASPLAAQQVPPDEPAPPMQQTAQSEPLPEPPPFPPMPKAKPTHRWTSSGVHHARSHHAMRARHRSAAKHHAKRTHASHGRAHKAKALHFSKRTVRACHKMTYRQIMRHKYCRALMSQELAATAHHHAHRHHRARAHRHHAAKRHRR